MIGEQVRPGWSAVVSGPSEGRRGGMQGAAPRHWGMQGYAGGALYTALFPMPAVSALSREAELWLALHLLLGSWPPGPPGHLVTDPLSILCYTLLLQCALLSPVYSLQFMM